MPSRRSHAKSHHGCTQCKQRRVKCDEAWPECGSCRKRLLSCSFGSERAPISHRSKTEDAIGTFPDSKNPLTPSSSTLPLLELELFHQWHSATSIALDLEKDVDVVARAVVARLAVSRPFLMHGVLALSAFHLMQSCSASKRPIYVEAAMRHKHLALSQFTPLLDHITEENCEALFALSSLVAILSFASQNFVITRTAKSVADVVDIFRLIRGVAAVVGQARKWIEKGALAPLLRKQPDKKTLSVLELPPGIPARLQSLFALCQRACPDDGILSMKLAAVQHLVDVSNASTAVRDGFAILAWPILIDAKFLDLLLETDQISLVILAHYGVILNRLNRVWWLKGYGRSLILMAADLLDEPWRFEILWPLEVTEEGCC